MTPKRRLLILVGMGLALVEAGIVYSPSYLFSPRLSLGSKIVCTIGVLSWSLLTVMAFVGLRLLLARPGRGAGRTAVRWVFLMGSQATLFGVLLSWVVHARRGSFVNFGTLNFVAHDTLQVLGLLTPFEQKALLLVLGVSVAVLALAFWLAAPPSALSGAGRRVAAVVAVLAFLTVSSLHLFPQRALSESERDTYVKQACFHSTPGLALLCSVLSRASLEAPLWVSLAPRFEGMEPYLSRLPEPRPPARNLVVIVVESMRRDSLRSLGAASSYMPFLDGLASRGLLFSNAYSQSNITHTSVSALLSSHFPLMFPDRDSLARRGYPRTMVYEVLKAMGYRTAIFTSNNDRWAGMVDYFASSSLDEYFSPESYDGPTLVPKEDTGFFRAMLLGGIKKGNLDDRVTVAHFLGWMRKDPDRPFFVYLNLQATHFPYEVAFGMETPFLPDALDFPASFFSYPREKREVMLNRYRNSLHFVDARIRDVVEAINGSRETIFVVTGDHGQAFFEHGTVTHGLGMYQEVVRVPLLVAGPSSVVAPRVDDRPIQGVDVLPTVFGLMGLPAHPDFQGTNVLEAGRDPDDHKLFLTTQVMERTHVLVWRGLKYLLREEGQDSFFSLREDPGEARDLLLARPGLARQYHDRLLQFMRTQLAFWAKPEYYTRSFPPHYE